MIGTFRFISFRQFKDNSFSTWDWYAVGEDGSYLKGFDEKLVPCGRYRISIAPKTGKFRVVLDRSFSRILQRRAGRTGWRRVACPAFCRFGMREMGIPLNRAFNVIRVRRAT